MSNINDCKKFGDNRVKESGLRVHAIFKNRRNTMVEQVDAIFFQMLSPPPPLNKQREPEDDILNCFAVRRKSRK